MHGPLLKSLLEIYKIANEKILGITSHLYSFRKISEPGGLDYTTYTILVQTVIKLSSTGTDDLGTSLPSWQVRFLLKKKIKMMLKKP